MKTIEENNVTLTSRSVVGISETPGQGPHMIIVLKVAHDKITQARYSTYGCTVAETCGQWVCDEIEGNTFEYAANLDEPALLKGVGGMPLGREHCPGLAINALKDALAKISL